MTITKLIAFVVAAGVVFTGLSAMKSTSGKAKTAIGTITLAVSVLGGLELISLLGLVPTDQILRPLFWDLDIITSLLLLAAINTLRSVK